MLLLDAIFSDSQIYRQIRGGSWFYIRFIEGARGVWIWTNKIPRVGDYIIYEEHYGTEYA